MMAIPIKFCFCALVGPLGGIKQNGASVRLPGIIQHCEVAVASHMKNWLQ